MADPKDDSGSMGDDMSDDARPGPSAGPSGSPVNPEIDKSWTSRRGKARCDSCRLRNLKCDRLLPVCNQCRWSPTGHTCTYTPLPTPAHRGVPRCDRCRESNLKCDRAAPICQYCRESNITDCRYTPKKRTRPSDQLPASTRAPYGSQSAAFMFTNISSKTHGEGDSKSDPMDVDSFGGKPVYEPGPPLTLLPAPIPAAPPIPLAPQTFIAHSFPDAHRAQQQIQPWAHPAFAPLPDHVLRRLTTVHVGEMPLRELFDTSMKQFRDSLGAPLRETAFLTAEEYAQLANCLAKGQTNRLSLRIRQWSAAHRFASGSEKYNLIVVPVDARTKFPADDGVGVVAQDAEEARLLKEYRAVIDGGSALADRQESDPPKFERLPVANQIYDCLVYAHRGHASAVAAMMEIRRLGIATITWPMAEIFVNLCPLCTTAGAAKTAMAAAGSSLGTATATKVSVSTGAGAAR